MSKYRIKPAEVEAFTFEEFVQYGREHATSSYNGVPWSFEFRGVPITHERDDCYLIPTLERIRGFMPSDTLFIDGEGQLRVIKTSEFERTYEKVADELWLNDDRTPSDLSEAVRAARGGDAPIQKQGFA